MQETGRAQVGVQDTDTAQEDAQDTGTAQVAKEMNHVYMHHYFGFCVATLPGSAQQSIWCRLSRQ